MREREHDLARSSSLYRSISRYTFDLRLALQPSVKHGLGRGEPRLSVAIFPQPRWECCRAFPSRTFICDLPLSASIGLCEPSVEDGLASRCRMVEEAVFLVGRLG